jgi:hypothetical protein
VVLGPVWWVSSVRWKGVVIAALGAGVGEGAGGAIGAATGTLDACGQS